MSERTSLAKSNVIKTQMIFIRRHELAELHPGMSINEIDEIIKNEIKESLKNEKVIPL